MNHKKIRPQQGFGINRLHPQQADKLHPHQPHVMQPKLAQASQVKNRPVAPPIYRLQPAKIVQPKIAHAAMRNPNQLVAPPVYRPQSTPKALQPKVASGQQARTIQPPRQPVAPARSASVQAKLSNTIQAAFSVAGLAARNRVNLITGGNNGFDPFGGFTFAQWHPHGGRIGFDNAIVANIVANAPHDNLGPPNWYTCPYCNYEYPLNRMQVDHIIPWAAYSALMTTAPNINAARAWEVYVGCNDPANLTLACQPCNGSKGQNAPTAVWIAGRQALALAQGGF